MVTRLSRSSLLTIRIATGRMLPRVSKEKLTYFYEPGDLPVTRAGKQDQVM